MGGALSSISTCVIVRDEERRIPGLLENISKFSDEIIVVDTGSKDGTIRLLSQHPKVNLFHFEWCDDFAKARNYSLEQATCEWILVLDADELIENPEALAVDIRRRLVDGYYLLVKSLQPEGSLTKYEEFSVCRLFKNRSHHRYVGRIHELVAPSIVSADGKLTYSGANIIHSGYQSPLVQGGLTRRERNKRILVDILKEFPNDEYYLYHLGLTIRFEEPIEAYKLFVRAIELGGKSMAPHLLEEMYMRMTQISLQSGDYESTLREARLCLGLNERNITALVAIIVSYMSIGEHENALPSLRIMVRHGLANVPNPEDFLALHDYCEQLDQVVIAS
jgi:glycosyltransferase involved in cell wall biosynthesis